ncbi:MAG: DMT family transporter [Sneathiella sp.]|nr:DMT family transporter [Sneathiella sp.]
MTRFLESPIALLLLGGTLIGFNFPLGKLASEAAVPPLVWAGLISLGVCLVVLPMLLMRGRLELPRGKTVRYVFLSALISFVIPNILLFTVIPYVGSGFSGLMFALSPVFTLGISLMARLKAPTFLGVVGILFGLLGAAIVSLSRSQNAEVASIFWILGALAVPLSLAFGNVYRTMDWPEGVSADNLAFWSHLAALGMYVVLVGFVPYQGSFSAVFDVPAPALIQLIVGGLTFPLFFRLQKLSGPVLLSQVGYVAAAVGLLMATIFLGERYSLITWGGAFVIGIGIAVSVAAEVRKARYVAA